MTILCDHEIEQLCQISAVLEVEQVGEQIEYIPLNKHQLKWFVDLKQIPYNEKVNSVSFEHLFALSMSNELGKSFQKEITSIKLVDLNLDNITKITKIAKKPMIFPFVSHSVNRNEKNEKILSYGLSSFGYDFRIAPEFKIFTNINNTIVDPKAFDEKAFVHYEGDVCIIPPNSFVLARTVEMFHMPDDVVGICVGKSTIARVGINCLVTPVEPGWNGYLTLEFANTTPLPAKLYANEGGLQIQFYRGKRPRVTYSDRGGKYQGQKPEVTLPKT